MPSQCHHPRTGVPSADSSNLPYFTPPTQAAVVSWSGRVATLSVPIAASATAILSATNAGTCRIPATASPRGPRAQPRHGAPRSRAGCRQAEPRLFMTLTARLCGMAEGSLWRSTQPSGHGAALGRRPRVSRRDRVAACASALRPSARRALRAWRADAGTAPPRETSAGA